MVFLRVTRFLSHQTAAISPPFIAILFAIVPFLFLDSPVSIARELQDSEAKEILKDSRVQGGLVVHLGCGDGTLTAALYQSPAFLVQGLETDPHQIEAARSLVLGLDRYGPVSIEPLRGNRLPYADALVRLLIVDNALGVSMTERLRVLCPGGVMIEKTRNGRHKRIKPWREDIDHWTHFLHDASNNAVADDTRVAPPRHLRWKCGPRWLRSHELTSSHINMVSANGRLFYIVDQGLTGVTSEFLPEKWTLTARDAFSGVLLWEKEFDQFRGKRWTNRSLRGVPDWLRRLLVAEGDRVFVPLGLESPVSILDAATGNVLKTLPGTEGASELRCIDGNLLVQTGRKGIMAYDSRNGKMIWQIDARPISNTLASQEEKVYWLEKASLVCVDLTTGRKCWETKNEEEAVKSWGRSAMLVVDQPYLVVSEGRSLRAFSSNTGKRLWKVETPIGGRKEIFIAQQKVWHWKDNDVLYGHDVETGEVVATLNPKDIFTPGHHLRCYQSKATVNYLLTPYRGVEFVSIQGKPHVQNDWIRGSCTYGVMPANGLLYVPPHPCFCYPGVKLTGMNVLSGEPADGKPDGPSSRVESSRLEKGPAYEEAEKLASMKLSSDDWPMYRHDARRSGSSSSQLSKDLSQRWEITLEGKLTPPVLAGDRVFVARKHDHVLFAFDATRGRQIWNYVAGGRIDSPPTILGELVFFGSADGYVQCLRAADGELVWRFRAAPSERRIVSYGRIESSWPVHGSVLFFDGFLYCNAGRSTFLDGGIHLFALDPVTGKVLHQKTLDTWSRTREDAVDKPFVPAYHMEGALSDLIVCENDALYMGQYKFDTALNELECPYILPKKEEEKPRGMDLTDKPFAAGDMKESQRLEEHQRAWLERSAEGIVSQLREKHGAFNHGHRRMGRHVLATFGLLDDTWFNRTYWMYSDSWPGFYLAHRAAKTGQLLVVGPERTYAVQAYNTRNMQSPLFTPGEKGYLLFADANDNEPVLDHRTRETTKGWGFTRSRPPIWHDWVPIRIRAMALAGKHLVVAGPPDIVDPEDPMGAFEGRKGAVLRVYDAEKGERLQQKKLTSSPVFDGLIVASGKVLLSTVDGKLLCFGTEENRR